MDPFEDPGELGPEPEADDEPAPEDVYELEPVSDTRGDE
jgi:hypothetical protein